jgi:hypothetical protein
MSATPETVVKSFYNWYAGYPGNQLVDGAYRPSEYLTTEFIRKVDEIIASFDKGGYDPFLCAQDIPESFTVDEGVISGKEANVVVHTSFEGHIFTIDLQQVDEQWKIADISCSVSEPLPVWVTYANLTFGVTLQYLAGWQSVPEYEERYRGQNGLSRSGPSAARDGRWMRCAIRTPTINCSRTALNRTWRVSRFRARMPA